MISKSIKRDNDSVGMQKHVEAEVIYEEASGDTNDQDADVRANPEVSEDQDAEGSAHPEVPEIRMQNHVLILKCLNINIQKQVLIIKYHLKELDILETHIRHLSILGQQIYMSKN